MTKEQIKFFIDNQETIMEEIGQGLDSINETLEMPETIDKGSIKELFDICKKYCSDIIDKYHIDEDAFKIIFSMYEGNKASREEFLGKDGANELLRDIIDIYEEDIYDLLGCYRPNFKMSEIEGLLLEENNQKYKDAYIKILYKKCETVRDLKGLSDILSDTASEYIKPEVFESFLMSHSNLEDYTIIDFMDKYPSCINESNIKIIIDKIKEISSSYLISKIPPELFDHDFSKKILEKTKSSFEEVFSLIPQKFKDNEVWQYAISKDSNIIFSLPQTKIDEKMTDEEYSNWCENFVLDEIRNNPDSIKRIFEQLPEYLKTTRVCVEGSQLLQEEGYSVNDFFVQIPKKQLNRQIFEILSKKSDEFIKMIPNESFEEGVSQEDYAHWLDDVLVKKISETKDLVKLSIFIGSEKMTESVWNALLDKYNEIKETTHLVDPMGYSITIDFFGLQSVLPKNMTIEMCERALIECGQAQIMYIPSIDRNPDTIVDRGGEIKEEEREDYKKWISSFTEEEKDKYRKWYESKVIDYINGGGTILHDRAKRDQNDFCIIPPEAISTNIIKAYIEKDEIQAVESLIKTGIFEEYNEQYEEIFLSVINTIANQTRYESFDIIEMLPEQYRTEKVIKAAIILNQKYLDYVSIDDENIDEFLQMGFAKKLESMGRTKLSAEEISLMKKFAENNSELFSTLNLEMFNEEILNAISEENLEKLVRYSGIQGLIIDLAKDKDKLILFKTVLEYLGKDQLYKEPLIEKISQSIFKIHTNNYKEGEEVSIWERRKDSLSEISLQKLYEIAIGLEKQKDIIFSPEDKMRVDRAIEHKDFWSKGDIIKTITDNYSVIKSGIVWDRFLKIVADRVQKGELSEKEKVIISYLTLNPNEANDIISYDEILNFVENKNLRLDKLISSTDTTLIDAKDAYLERTVGMSYEKVIELINQYGNDPEELLKKYLGKELKTYKEKSEKESLEIIIKLKSLIQEEDLEKIREAYQETVKKEDKEKSFERYKYAITFEDTLGRAYGRDIAQTISNQENESNIETIEHTEDGEQYVVKKLNGSFKRMVSFMNAYRKSSAEGDMYDKWNTTEMANNHALCYSLINESNPGTAMMGDKRGIIISIRDFDAEAVTAVAPYDLQSDSRENTTKTYRDNMFFCTNNLPDMTRCNYSEIDIELQDVSQGTTEYKKIQPSSIICFEEVDEDSIKAAIELSKKLGRTIPIELIDRRELANRQRAEIDALFEHFKNSEKLQPELVHQIINEFGKARNAFRVSSLSKELVGEKYEKGKDEPISCDENAIFCRVHLNRMLMECLDTVKRRIENGELEEGIKTIEQIKQFIKTERDKNLLMPTMYDKFIMTAIDLDIDYCIDEILRIYGKKEEILPDQQNESMEILKNNNTLESISFEIASKQNPLFPEQIPFEKFRENIDIEQVENSLKEIQQKGHYSKNTVYSEEYIARVIMFSDAIANFEEMDGKTKKLLLEVAKYNSCGRVLDNPKEQDQCYSAKIAGEKLCSNYSKKDLGIIQASIELQRIFTSFEYRTVNDVTRKRYKDTKIMELCDKYGIDYGESGRIETIAKYISDAIILDKVRFVDRVYKIPEEKFYLEHLQTDTAKKMVQASYCIQDELSMQHLDKMRKIFRTDGEKTSLIEKPNTRCPICHGENARSPIVQEAYFLYKYREIEDPVSLGIALEQYQDRTQEEDITKEPIYTEQEIGKATVYTPLEQKQEAERVSASDMRDLGQTKVVNDI